MPKVVVLTAQQENWVQYMCFVVSLFIYFFKFSCVSVCVCVCVHTLACGCGCVHSPSTDVLKGSSF